MVDSQEIKDKIPPIFYVAKVQENLYFKGSLLISLIILPNSLEVRILFSFREKRLCQKFALLRLCYCDVYPKSYFFSESLC